VSEASTSDQLGPSLSGDRSLTAVGRTLLVIAAAGAIVLTGVATDSVVVGALGAVGLLLAWVGLATPYAFAVGWVGVAAVVGAGGPLPPAALLTGVLLVGLLVVPDDSNGEDRRDVALTAVGVVTLATVAVVSVGWTALPLAALFVVLTGGLLGYAVHRYEQVRLGVVRDE